MADHSENNQSIIDLTNCSYERNLRTVPDHRRWNEVICIDDSFREEASQASNVRVITPRSRTGRKRRHPRTRITVDPETPVHDLCTPENQLKRRSINSDKVPHKISLPDDEERPREKKAKLELGSCPICFEDFCGQPLASTKCGHVFCMACLKSALRRVSRCPTCRAPLKGSLKYHAIFL